jgi:carboxyl-terminal processing protease
MIKFFKNRFVRIFTVITVLTAGGVSFAYTDEYFEISRNMDIFTTLFRELNIYYVDDTKPGDLMKKGIDSMLESLDPYTNYIPESEVEDYRFMTTGQYGGIGALIGQKKDYVVITDPYEGFPAHKADLRAGDVVIKIDDKELKGLKYDEVSKLLKGQPKTSVKITIQRPGFDDPIVKEVVRDEIKINSVSYSGMLNDEVGYIRLTGFTDKASHEVKEALLDLKL